MRRNVTVARVAFDRNHEENMTGMLKKLGYCVALSALTLLPMGCDESGHHHTSVLDPDDEMGGNPQNPTEQNPQNPTGQNPQNPTGQNPQGCGDVPDTGRCNGDVVDYCENGELKSYNCAQNSQTCGMTSAETNSYGCVDKSGGAPSGGCGDVPDTGRCNGDVVDYCENGELKSYNCAQNSQTCGMTSAETNSYGCVDKSGGAPSGGCGDVPDTGRCNGTVVEYCKDGKAETYDCAQNGEICGLTSAETNSYGCIATTVTPEPPAGDLKTAEDWARARIAGTVSTEDAFNAIAYNGGFPVITDDNTVIFMHWYSEGPWVVVGDFNSWEGTPMKQNGDIWYAEVPMPENVKEKNYYKFLSASTGHIADPWSLRYTYTAEGEISYIIKPDKPYLERYHNFKSPQGLNSRTLRIYMPAGEGPFDVLYAHDAQNLFGTGTVEYGSWKVEENMEKAGASFMVVGIDNMGAERLSEYAFADEDLTATGFGNIKAKGDLYAKFVQETVRPFIEKTYKVTKKAGLMGSSMGGLISLYIAHLYPKEYKAVLALSPTTAWGRFSHEDGTTIEDMYVAAGHRDYILYLDNGGYAPAGGTCPEKLGTLEASSDEFGRDCYCYTRSFVDKMAEIGYTWEEDLFHVFVEGAEHNEGAWAARLVKPLTIFKDAK